MASNYDDISFNIFHFTSHLLLQCHFTIVWSWPCLNYDSLRNAMTVENINLTLVQSFFLVLLFDSIRFNSMTFNVKKQKSISSIYIICKHNRASIFRCEGWSKYKKPNITHQIIIRSVNTLVSSEIHTAIPIFSALSTAGSAKKLWFPQTRFARPYTSDDVLLPLWLLSLAQHSSAVHCIQKEEKLIKRLDVCATGLCICVCATSFSGPTEDFLSPFFQPWKLSVGTERTKWKIEGKSAYRAWLNTICFACLLSPSLSSFSPKLFGWLAGWMFCLLASNSIDESDKRR